MRKILLLIFLSFSMAVFSQDDTASANPSLRQRLLSNDSVAGKLLRVKDSVARAVEIRQREDANTRAMLELYDLQKERRAKEKRNAFIRIGIGLLFLVVLVVGLMRRRVKK